MEIGLEIRVIMEMIMEMGLGMRSIVMMMEKRLEMRVRDNGDELSNGYE